MAMVTYKRSVRRVRRSAVQLSSLSIVAQLSALKRMVDARSMMCSGNEASAQSSADPILRNATASVKDVVSQTQP